LRFFRFLAWYGRSEYAVEAIKACALLAPKTAGLAGERIAAELFTTLEAPDPVPVFETMVRHRILEAVTPELCDINRLRSLCAFEGAVGVADPLRRFAALIVGNTAAATTIGDRLNLSGKQRQRLITITQGSELVAVEMNKKAARVALYRLRQEAFADLVLLEFASGSDIDRGAGPARALLAYADSWSIPTLPISGRDLLGQGIPEGPRIGRQLEELETWWVANDFEPDRRAMLDRVTSVSGSD
jgi:poly(A) polymerase